MDVTKLVSVLSSPSVNSFRGDVVTKGPAEVPLRGLFYRTARVKLGGSGFR